MNTTGIVRRIDELGRVVIPKEIRRRFKIKDGDPIEIFVDENGIILRPYEEDSIRDANAILEDLNNNNIPNMSACELLAFRALLTRYLEIKKEDE
jgi:AbrB family looped-hinge helix DNA binding protein